MEPAMNIIILIFEQMNLIFTPDRSLLKYLKTIFFKCFIINSVLEGLNKLESPGIPDNSFNIIFDIFKWGKRMI